MMHRNWAVGFAAALTAASSSCGGEPQRVQGISQPNSAQASAVAVVTNPSANALAATTTAVSSSPVQGPPTHDVAVRYDSASNEWHVDWSFSEAAVGVLLDRGSDHARPEWQVGPDLAWGFAAPRRHTLSAVGQPRRAFGTKFLSVPTEPKLPPFIRHLKDGGRMIDLVTVGAHAMMSATDKRPRRWDGTKRWGLSASDNWLVRLGDQVAPSELKFEMTRTFPAAFAYVGPSDGVDLPHMRLFVSDPVPAWVIAEAGKRLDGYLVRHAKTTSRTLARKPNVFIIWTKEGKGAFYGRARSGDFVLDLVGEAWEQRKTAPLGDWEYLLAHEAFHLFNNGIRNQRVGRWLVEGGADYAALMAMRDRGLYRDREVGRQVAAKASICFRKAKGPLNLRQTGDKTDYACGAIIHFLVDHATRSKGGVLTLLGELFAMGAASNGYTTAQYLSLVAAKSADPRVTKYVSRIVKRGFGPQGAKSLRAQLERAGLRTRIVQFRGMPVFRPIR